MTAPPARVPRPPRWPLALLAASAAWSVAARVPLVLNAAGHLDSDLAVDGLTLLDAARGHGRWHYPGTPFIGTGPVLLSLPQALCFGTTPATLVSGGTVAWVGLTAATFLLAWRAFGPSVAAWSLAPLTFASAGAVWLSGRITGGHLVAAAWHAGAFAGLAAVLDGVRLRRGAAALGFWCGLGMALDSMFAVSLAGVVAGAGVFWVARGTPRRGAVAAAVFALAFCAGVWPRYAGAWADPYDAYREQFSAVSEPELLASHARLLFAECLPRLLAGHRLPSLETDPDPHALASPPGRRRPSDVDAVGAAAVGLTAAFAAGAVFALAGSFGNDSAGGSRAVVFGLAVSAAATLAGFVANRNIFNSDNYRYLVGLLVPWSLGCGLFLDGTARRGRKGAAAAAVACAVFAAVMTADLSRWYARFGWVEGGCVPVRKPLDDPTLDWLAAHPGVTWIDGGYWDVYRVCFLTGGRVRGAPFPVYPNRFPDWAPPGDGQRVTLVRRTPEGVAFREKAVREGLRPVREARGVTILARP